MIRLLLVDDSAVQREFLSYILEEAADFEIVGTAADGEEAAKQAGLLHPDIILMDCHMPKLDGIAATRLIMETCPTPIVIATASPGPSDARLAFDAIKNGALAMVIKPPAIGTPTYAQSAAELVRTLRLMSEVKVVRRWPVRSGKRAEHADSTFASPHHTVRIVALVGSTGAPSVIAEILGAIGPDTRAAVLVVQHMAEGFVEGFATWLTARTGMAVQTAKDGTFVRPGCAYLAPDGKQMGIDATGCIVLSADLEVDGFRPSGTYLLRAVAGAFGAQAMGVLLTGIGRDGAAGLLDVRRAGGVTVAQDEETCVVFGMPGEAIRLGAAMHVLRPSEIVRVIKSCTSAGETERAARD